MNKAIRGSFSWAYIPITCLLLAPPTKAQGVFQIQATPATPAAPVSSNLEMPETVMMELWGIQISSSDPARLSTVMDQVNREIDLTRRAMQFTFEALLKDARKIPIEWMDERDSTIKNGKRIAELTGELGLPRLSLTDALFRINMANDASSIYLKPERAGNPYDIPNEFKKQINRYNAAANDLCDLFATDEKQIYTRFNRFEGRELNEYKLRRFIYGDVIPKYRRPFQRFQEIAFHQRFPATSRPKCGDGNIRIPNLTEQEKSQEKSIGEIKTIKERERAIKKNIEIKKEMEKLRDLKFEWARRQKTLREFTQFADTVPMQDKSLAQRFDAMLAPIVVAINQDIDDFFIRPTLHRIKQIVGRDYNVEYAEVGRTTLVGLNGIESKIISETISSVDEPTPLRLDKLIKDAKTNKDNLDALFPKAADSTKSIGKINPTLAGLPFAGLSAADSTSAAALLAALSTEEVRWRGIPSGTNIAITPTVFNDQTGAKLKIIFTIGSATTKNGAIQNGATINLVSKDNPLRDPSRIVSNTVDTTVRVNTWDLFALSSLNNQTTITGRRWNVPLFGPIWEGIFGDIPVVGNLLSPKAPPLTVHHQNIILVNTLVVPSGNGLANYLLRP